MKTIHIFLIFILVALCQLFVPAKMIFNRETVLSEGTPYKFKTRPIDPSDPFRGKYIILNYDANNYKTKDSSWLREQEVFVYIDVDSLGFVKIDTISKKVLSKRNRDYVKAEVGSYQNYSNEIIINYPFNRYYMEESKAYDAEVAVRRNRRESILKNTYALVYIKDGEAVLKDVVIDEMSIKDYVKNMPKSN